MRAPVTLEAESDGGVPVEVTRRVRLWVDPRWRHRFEERGWNTYDAVVGFFTRAHPQPWPRLLLIRPGPASEGMGLPPVYFKLYHFPCFDGRPWHKRSGWRYWGRDSKAAREFRNYGVFERLGVSCARRVAWGERRDLLGRLRSAFIVTEAVLESVTLPEFLDRHAARSGSGLAWDRRLSVIRQLARMTRRIHAAGFFHNDLFGRNVLVRLLGAGGEPEVYWIDCPRGARDTRPRHQRRLRVKDLAALDLTGAEAATRTERLRFMLEYCGEPRLTPSVKRLMRDVIRYRQSR